MNNYLLKVLLTVTTVLLNEQVGAQVIADWELDFPGDPNRNWVSNTIPPPELSFSQIGADNSAVYNWFSTNSQPEAGYVSSIHKIEVVADGANNRVLKVMADGTNRIADVAYDPAAPYSNRAELSWLNYRFMEDEELYYTMSFKLDDSWTQASSRPYATIITQLKPFGTGPMVELMVRNDGSRNIHLHGKYFTAINGDNGYRNIGNAVVGEWVHVKMYVKLTTSTATSGASTGKVIAWINGVKTNEYTGRTLELSNDSYLKLGQYGQIWDRKKVVYFDNVRLEKMINMSLESWSKDQVAKIGDTFIADYITYQITDTDPNSYKVSVIDYNTAEGPTTVNIPSTIQYQEIYYAVTSIGSHAFARTLRTDKLTSVIIPNGVKSIGTEAFRENLLSSVTIPNSVISIGNNAFNDNELTAVTFESPGNLTSIGASTFKSNDLTEITIPGGVITIGNSAFSQNQLISVTIPKSVTSIDVWAFAGNPITNIQALGNTPPGIQGNTFANHGQIDVIVPRGTPHGSIKGAYEQAWDRDFKSIEEGVQLFIEGTSEIDNLSPFEITFQFATDVTGFTIDDISLEHATLSDFTGDSSLYTVKVTPTICNGIIEITVLENVAEYASNFPNLTASKTVTVNANPPTLTVTPGPPVCAGDNAIFTIEGGNKDDVVIYDDGTSTRTITIPAGGKATVPVNGVSSNTTLTLKEVSNRNCNIELSEMATVTVNDLPVAPTVSSSPVEYCVDETATALTATGDNLLWYTSEKGGTGEATAPIPGTANAGSTTHYVSQTTNGCESDRAVIVVTVVEACLVQIGDGFTVLGIEYKITSVNPNEVEVVDYIGSATAVEIPETVDDKNETYAVIAIGANAFSDNPDLDTVKIEATHLLSIHDDAFADRSQVDLVVSTGMRQAYIDAGLTGFASITEEKVVTAIHNYEFKDFTLYPNPARDKVYIDIDPRSGQELKQVNIYTMDRAYLHSENGPVINTALLPRGTYLFEIVTKKGDRSMRKVIIQ